MTLCLGVPVPLTQKQEVKGQTTRSKFSRVATVSPRTPTATLNRTTADAMMCQDSLVGLGAPERVGPAGAGGEAHYYGIATEELRYGYAGDANRARDDSDPSVSMGCAWFNVWRTFCAKTTSAAHDCAHIPHIPPIPPDHAPTPPGPGL